MKQPRAALPLAFGLVLTVAATFLISSTAFRSADAADELYRCDDSSLYFPVAGEVGWRYGDPASTDTDAAGNPTDHTGVDVYADNGAGAPVYAPADGMVSRISGTDGVNLILFDVTNVLNGEPNIELYVTHVTHALASGQQFKAGDVIGEQAGDHVHFSVGAFMGFDDRQIGETQDPSPYFGAILTYDPSVSDRYDVAVWCDPSAADVEIPSSPTPTPMPSATPAATEQPAAGTAPASTATATEQEYVVQTGDTLGAIAESFGVTVEAIAEASGLEDVDLLEVGQRLVIPGEGAPATATGTGSPSQTPAAQLTQTYVVEEGDTLFSIAESFGVTIYDIASANAMTDLDFLSIGQELDIPSGSSAGGASTPGAAPEPAEGSEHVVQDGDTLSTIAETYGTDVETLQTLNGIEDAAFIAIGDTLQLP